MATEFDSGGGSKRQRTDDEGEQPRRDAEAAEKDHISTLPEELRLHILALLPFKSAIRTGALSTQWRALWTYRWPAPSSLELRVPAQQESSRQLMETMERRGPRRLDRFSLSFQIGGLSSEDFRRSLDYAAACAVADLDVQLSYANEVSGRALKFRLPPGNPHLERLSLGGIRFGLSDSFCPETRPYSALEAIHLHRVTVSDFFIFDATVFDLVAACPVLRTLDLRYCKGLFRRNYLPTGTSLKSVTVAECEYLTDVLIREEDHSGLRSLRYSGGYLNANLIPTILDDLYLCFGGPDRKRSGPAILTRTDDGELRLCRMSCLDALINCSNLTVLTLCSSALRRVSGKARAKSIAGSAALCQLRNLREVQLLMFAMYNENLHDIMYFLMICCSSRLERLFVQLPTRSDQYKPDEEPPESEEDGPEDDGSEEDELEEELSEGEESDEDQSEQDELEEMESMENHSKFDASEEEVSEEYHPKEDESGKQGSAEGQLKGNGSKKELSDGEQSEQDELKEMESGENHSKVGASEKEVSEEYHSKEDESEEQGSAEGQTKEDGSKKEPSDGGQSAEEPLLMEEPLGDGCENLMLLKMENFKGRHNEMRLVSFVLKKSASLNQLILFTPSDHLEGLHKDHPNTSEFLETKLLPLEKASPNAQIILSEPDDTAVQPLHWETFVEV